jgi:hypothetical protein
MSVGNFPLDRDLREKMREQTLQDHIVKAVNKARRLDLSIKCGGDTGIRLHASMDGGCTNDGKGCLCECHDVATPPLKWEVGKLYRHDKDVNPITYRCVHIWPTGKALMAWGDGASCRLGVDRRLDFHEVTPVLDDGSAPHNTFREST